MLYVGSRDGRKALGLGFGVEGEMEETELEEGEACYYRDDDTSIDPDVALSYIDEKLQDVLGQFRKDFEGGVSAENLGAKFGGYGSFLPTYQRSPSVWSHPRSPQKAQNYSTPRSPNNLLPEGAHQNSTISSSAPLFARLGYASSSAVPLPDSKTLSVDNLVKLDVCLYSAQDVGEFTRKNEPVNKLVNPTDQKTLKVRIRVGTDNMSGRKNAEIYSGLGLDISPSSSLEDSPAESGGMSPEYQETLDESPTSILQIMTSFPVPGGQLLSPIPDSLLRLTEKEKHLRDSRSRSAGHAHKGSLESYTVLVDESASIRGDGNVSLDKKKTLMEKNGRSVELKNGSGKDAGDDISSFLKREIDIEIQAGKESVSNVLKLPLPSNSKSTVGDTAIVTGRASDISRATNKSLVKDEFISFGLGKEEALDSISSQEASRAEKHNAKTSSAETVWEDKKASSRKEVSADSRKGGSSKGDKSYYPSKSDSNVSKGGKDPPISVGQKATFHEMGGMKLLHGRDQTSSGGKRKSKGSQSNGTSAAELPKESLRVGSSAKPKDKKKSTHARNHSSSKVDDVKLHKELGKARESNRDLFEDTKLEQAESRMDSLEPHSKDRPKDSKFEVVEKETRAFADISKETSNGKRIDNPLTSEAYLKAAPNAAPLTENVPVSDVSPAVVAPVVIEDNWVCCDRCQKWRLLPHGTNPDHLPKKWLCSMLNWLPPGMNRCSISEEETTKALNAYYQAPVPESQHNLQSYPGRASFGGTLVDIRHFEQNHQDFSFHAVPSGRKKKNGSKGISIAASHSGPTQFSDSAKKNQQAYVKSRGLYDANESPMESNPVNEPGFQHFSKSSDLALEKHKHKQREKQKMLESYPDGDDAKHSKEKSKREAVQDGFKSSKKIKTEGAYYTDEDGNSGHGGAIGRMRPGSSSGLPAKATGKDLQKYKEYSSSKDSKCDTKDSLLLSVKEPKDQVQVSLDGGSLDMGKYGKGDSVVKKRKVKEWQDSLIHSETLPSIGHHLQDNRISVKETKDSERRKEKKARVSKSNWKESSTSKGDGRTDKKGRVNRALLSGSKNQPVDGMEEGKSTEKDQQLLQYRGNTVSQRNLEGIDLLKRDLGYGQPSMAATSSSSKVSGSRKTKANVKGSPVESVSSSPLRISNPDKLTSAKRNLLGKDDPMNAGLTVVGSPRRCSDAEGEAGSDRSGTVRKEKTFSIIHRGSLESSILDCQDMDANHILSNKAKIQTEFSPPEFENVPLVNGGTDYLDQHCRYHNELLSKDHCHDEERVNNNHYHTNGYLPQKSGKGFSLQSKEKHSSSKSDNDIDKIKASDSLIEQEELYPKKSLWCVAETESHDGAPYHEEMRDKNSFPEKFGIKSNKDEKKCVGKKESAGKWSSESGRRETQSKFGRHEGSDVKLGAICSKEGKSTPQQNLLQDREGQRSSNLFLSDRTERMEIESGQGNLSGDKQETLTRCPPPVPGSPKGGGSDALPVDASGGGDLLKASKQLKKVDNQNGAHHNSLRHHIPNGHGIRGLSAPSPVRKDSSSQAAAANALKEAKDLKHTADRLKNSGADLETTALYFEAALKFLHGASLCEPFTSESVKHGEMTQSVQVYTSTAKLCDFCAREYERRKEMASAALAYKCMEVAYMRVIYSKNSSASRDRHELQSALQLVPPGESPSSSASDVDNLNNQATLDKVSLAKGISSPQVAGNHVIVARNRPNFVRLLDFAQYINFAMEASRKSQNAFAVANSSLEEARHGEGISSVKRVLDFNFQDVEGLLRLVEGKKKPSGSVCCTT
ncbi:hypothetical protein HHK36_020746 [Tetracentron sinense]|uniref:CW-type domain-containing protein n=1 Tax=Tetracentron sinense TaxID=13715 RepID=A0A834YUJ9_TETSI|nr:hypothetical protein HHK36_020746 [Tetracentron sinense]